MSDIEETAVARALELGEDALRVLDAAIFAELIETEYGPSAPAFVPQPRLVMSPEDVAVFCSRFASALRGES